MGGSRTQKLTGSTDHSQCSSPPTSRDDSNFSPILTPESSSPEPSWATTEAQTTAQSH